MERRHFQRGFCAPTAAASIGTGAHPARSARRLRRCYQLERLEDRLLMNADDALADGVTLAADDVPVLVADIAKPTDAMQLELPERFQSTAEFEAWLIEAAVAQWGHLFGQTTHYPGWEWGVGYALDQITVMPFVLRDFALNTTLAASAALSADASFSTTNLQVDGVDEADLVETDGQYLYILSGQDLVIVEAGIGDELQIASRIHFDEEPVGMYLSGDRLAIVSSAGGMGGYFSPVRDIRLFSVGNVYAPAVEPPTTTVTVLDVTDRAAPTMVQKSRLDGQLLSSRVVDGELRLVLTNTLNLPAPIARPVEGGDPDTSFNGDMKMPPTSIDSSGALIAIDYWYPYSGTEYVYETQDEYLARVTDEILKSAAPALQILGPDGELIEERALVDATDVYRPEHASDRSLTTIATFDLTSNAAGPAATATVLTGQSTQVYATAESLYLFSAAPYDFGIVSWNQSTRIHKFDFDPETHSIALAARGSVEGTLLNQFAADEHGGYLRVVTTPAWGNEGQSVFVLEQVGKRLEVVGSVDGLAPGELIYSVRFMGERAFLVTYRKVDPLFALDLSDPTDPRVLGELKIPGYSDYLQPIDENHLLAIGRGADESTGLFQELQVSIFNIADLTDPQLVDRYSFDGGRSIATPATGDRWQRGDGDHHAVSYFADAGIFALPIYNTGEVGWWWSGDDSDSALEPGRGGLQVFQIDVVAGFTPLALIEHDTSIERSVQIGEHLFAISSGTVTAHSLADPANQLGELDIAASDGSARVELAMFQVAELSTMEVGESSTPHDAGEPVKRPLDRVGLTAAPVAGLRLEPDTSRRSRPIAHRAHQAAFSVPDEWLLLGRPERDVPEELSQEHARRQRNSSEEAVENAGRRVRHWSSLDADLADRLAEPLVSIRR
jgi:hypothetical protein